MFSILCASAILSNSSAQDTRSCTQFVKRTHQPSPH